MRDTIASGSRKNPLVAQAGSTPEEKTMRGIKKDIQGASEAYCEPDDETTSFEIRIQPGGAYWYENTVRFDNINLKTATRIKNAMNAAYSQGCDTGRKAKAGEIKKALGI